MAIEKLPPQLANQIAAGEVVERPASVIKELVENSLDAGATRVDIEIEKGGAKLIRIRDNGSGIPKEDLSLALSRHATSKLKSLDDLEAILSFGFRGEALASISSVSRLTLTSRTAEQTEAWQAQAEGTEMAVKVLPAAHPVGSTVEAVDLFFNTPARRRFLKSDKTEFTHIDEWLKRIALARRDIYFTLKHNGKTVRNYRPANTEVQYIQRLGQICGKAFAETCLKIECQHNDLSLSGYLQSPNAASGYSETQYFYVNGRLVKDRLVNHAVRQAFAQYAEGISPGYVLMLELDPHQVDVNVHPAKHEVRFHQSRYVHDYILQALQSAMSQSVQLPVTAESEPQPATGWQATPTRGAVAAAHYPADNASKSSAHFDLRESQPASRQVDYSAGSSRYRSELKSAPRSNQASSPSPSSIRAYGELLNTDIAVPQSSNMPLRPESAQAGMTTSSHGTVNMPPIIAGKYWVLIKEDKISLLDIAVVTKAVLKAEIGIKFAQGLIGQPLLMPVAVAVDNDWAEIIENREQLLRKLGIELSIRLGQLIIKKVPPYLRNSQLAVLIPELLQWVRLELPSDEAIIKWLADQATNRFACASEAWFALNTLPNDLQGELYNQSQDLPWEQWIKENQSDR
ncbi:DNA mismatch repair endonuclease MutL [Shewanella schlegeliana]|uniref:DNA mismatch repair protein MutL n=1 Tax=Shewanella schlegeliana TaxID=190308 RepID=A0ABS1SW61_9GAMM|nr:DNA mismatch repair endonuclease MutL [Shewanella schlegeliana]MBL4912780.1 DNA mismatch repair endonuclease MutL [Shewanella schlegeliana]MCL1111879.1 DNA mismatch repair endonuclease MutL [Shewanella schlegeliana]GIU30635.1 DNA mismatch repair protein MutL [Shewanella schlegeliana]